MKCKKCNTDAIDGAIYCHKCGSRLIPSTRKPRARGNGFGSAYKRGPSWEARVESHAGGIRTVKTKCGFKTKKEALEYLNKMKTESVGNSTIASLWSVYNENAMQKLSESKQCAYKIAYKRFEDIRGIKMCDLTISHIQSCVNKNATSYYTARDMKIVLSHLYKMAMAQREANVNLSQFITLPDLNEAEPTPFTESELSKLWTLYDIDNSVGYILLMIYTGMMPGELMNCEKAMVHFDQHAIIGCGLKTKVRKKTPLMIADIIEPVLRGLMTISPTNMLLNMKRNDFYDWFDTTLKTAGCRDLTPYACRHTTATALALGNKVAPSIVQKIMRHSSIKTTQRYIHPDTSDMLKAVNTIYKPSK